MTTKMGDFLCIGDYISLFCEETEGYVYNCQTSSTHNGLYIYQWQDRDKPGNIPCPQAVQFQICIQNRYKLNKKYRKILPLNQDDTNNNDSQSLMSQAKMAADAENDDNVAEQRRQHGKRVRYGEVLQLRHVFTGKHIHVSTTQTSRRDKNNMMVFLQEYNAKHAQFKILPRYKVKSEGEFVQIFDQIVLESVKSPGQYFHASAAWKIDHFNIGSELNLGIQPAGFTVVRNFRPSDEQRCFIRGSSVVRLFHKELEAYLVAEGLFDDEVTEDVHLRIREVDQLVPKSLYPSTSGNTYWQIEAESSILNGDVLRWEQQIRFRHMTTRQYLYITSDRRVTLTPDCRDPKTVFRLHPVIKEMDEIQFESYARIEHVITGYWLHALRDEEYIRKGLQDESGDSMKSLRWDGASLRKISASGEKIYHDAYTIQQVEDKHMTPFIYVSGMVPFLLNMSLDRQENKILNAKKAHKITAALTEMKNFMLVKGEADKSRQKLMRNLRVIDLLVRLLQCPLQGAIDQTHLTRVFKGAYDVLYTYMIGNSRKNALYFAKYIEFFQTQISVKGDIGLNVAQMIVELIRDNRKIVDRITKDQIAEFVGLLRQNKNYRYLDLLNVLCVCDGVAIPDNQSYICDQWLRKDRTATTKLGTRVKDKEGQTSARFLTERGQNVNGQPNIIYVSTDNAGTWHPLHEFVDKENNLAFSEEEVMFFEHQLDLYGKLAYGRNDFVIFVITRELGILTWDEAFLSLRSTLLPDTLRAKYCELIIGLFIDVGTNYSVLDHTNLSFIYEDVLCPGPNADGEFVRKLPAIDNWISPPGVKRTVPPVENWLAPEGSEPWQEDLVEVASFTGNTPNAPLVFFPDNKIIKDLVTLFPVIRDWISEFLSENKDMTASMIGRNKLIEQVLRLFHFLVKFGYYGSEDIKTLLKPLLNLLNGRIDKPFPPDNEKGGFTKESMKLVNNYRNKERYEPSPEALALTDGKYQAMEVMDLLLTFQFNTRLESFISRFKAAETTAGAKKAKQRNVLSPLLYDDFDPFDQSKKGLHQQKKALKELKAMFETTAYFDSDNITATLMDLSNYKYDKMVNKSLALLNKYYSSKTKLFKMAVQALVLITTDSCHVHREVSRTMPILRRYSKAKLGDDQVKTMGGVLDRYVEFCHLPKEETERHPMNQNILINHEILTLVFDILSQEIDAKLMEQYRGLEEILKKSLKLLKALARGNDVVQMRMFERLDTLLKIKVVESDLSVALKETFIGNQVTCLKVLPQQIQTIVDLAAGHQENAPEFLDLLNVIVKVEGLGLTLKRNQAYVMKYIMQDYNKVAYVLDQPREFREKILTNRGGKPHLMYLINLVDLLATCAEGENRFIESMCQTIMSVDELLWVINHPDIDPNLKKPFLRYFLWVYMKTAGSAIESGAGDLPHDGNLWKFLQHVSKEAYELTEYISRNQEAGMHLLKKLPDKVAVADPNDIESIVHCTIHYMFDAVMPVIQAFYTKFYVPEKDLYPAEVENTDKLARSLVGFCESAISLVTSPSQLKAIISCMTAVVPASTVPNSVMEGLVEQLRNSNRLRESRQQVAKGHKEYYAGELELNAKLRTFSVNCSLMYGGHNTVQAQLKYKSKRGPIKAPIVEYTTIGGDEEIPLGEEFQEHLKRFVKGNEKKVPKKIELVKKLVDQLEISASCHRKLPTEAKRIEQEELDIRCLQLLRAVIHNEERKLPENWEENPQDHKKQILQIRELQIELNEMGAVIKVLPHLARPSDRIAKEVLAFLCIMLFNANAQVQSALLHYFLHTREESFFAAIRNRMHLSALAIKERRSLAAQQRARMKEVLAQTKSMQTTMAVGKRALERKVSLSTLQSKAAKRRTDKQKELKQPKKKKPKENSIKMNGFANDKMKDSQTLINSEQIELEAIEVVPAEQGATANKQPEAKESTLSASLKDDELEEIDQKDDGYIELVLRVLARMCDGQHSGLQDYLREQPDNMKSFNIVAETAQFVNLVYSNINSQTIDLVTQLFETLNEFTVGNQYNRSVMLNSKVIDYINFILRAGEFKGCPLEKVLELKHTIGNLLISLIEENSPDSLIVAKTREKLLNGGELDSYHPSQEIKDTLDKEAIYRCMASCYEMSQPDRPKLEALAPKKKQNVGISLASAKNLAKLGTRMLSSITDGPQTQETKEKLDEVGFVYYLVLARLLDLGPNKKLFDDDVQVTPLQQEAYNHYKKNTMSIEILKDDNLQKVNFRVKNKNVLRDEVKEKMTWNVDRSSPSNKIRDLMKWSKDILKDIYYQRKILSNPLATFLTKNWLFWNKMAILLSVAINILMLVTWNARASLATVKVPDNATKIPVELTDPWPKISMKRNMYDIIIYALGGAHNFFSFLVLITYFLSNHPTLPKFEGIRKVFRKLRPSASSSADDVKQKEKDTHESKLEVMFLSFSTVYYFIFLGMSVAGTVFQGYFFAFHLLNVVNNNQLLRGVIMCVAQNGRSLLWVAVLGMIIFYLYALVSFALLRTSFNPSEELYCATLWQCTVTVIRYGLIGDIFENLSIHSAENTFFKFGFLVIFHLSFFIFITTIGLNIILGIIVDTFSELRDLKWTAERDMRDTCFICSRNSYDFEHHGMGFDHHINQEHQIWAYIFFFIHLHDTKQSDYTALELYVHKLLKSERYDFFPLNRALSLSAMDEDSTESKVDELLNYVMTLVEKQKEEDARKKREEERQKQLRWREMHRNALMQGHQDSMDTQDSNGTSNGKINRDPTMQRAGQRFRQKRWQRESKSQLMHLADSVDTQDSNTTINKFKESTSHEDLLEAAEGPGSMDIPEASGEDSEDNLLDQGPGAESEHERMAPETLRSILDSPQLIDFTAEGRAPGDLPRPEGRTRAASIAGFPGQLRTSTSSLARSSDPKPSSSRSPRSPQAPKLRKGISSSTASLPKTEGDEPTKVPRRKSLARTDTISSSRASIPSSIREPPRDKEHEMSPVHEPPTKPPGIDFGVQVGGELELGPKPEPKPEEPESEHDREPEPDQLGLPEPAPDDPLGGMHGKMLDDSASGPPGSSQMEDTSTAAMSSSSSSESLGSLPPPPPQDDDDDIWDDDDDIRLRTTQV